MARIRSLLSSLLVFIAAATSAAASCSVSDYVGDYAIFSNEMSLITDTEAKASGWKNTYKHPADSSVIVRFGSIEVLPTSKQDEALFRQRSSRSEKNIEMMFKSSGYDLMESEIASADYSWSVSAISGDRSVIAEYYSRRVSDACEFTASWSLPAQYQNTAVHTRITSAIEGIASIAASMSGPVVFKKSQERPTGHLAVFVTSVSTLVAALVFYALFHGVSIYRKAYLGLYGKLTLGLGLSGFSLWMSYDILQIIRMRENIENMELIFVAIGICVFSAVWVVNIHKNQASSFFASLAALSSVIATYFAMGWHWDKNLASTWVIGIAALTVIATIIFRRSDTFNRDLDKAEINLQYK